MIETTTSNELGDLFFTTIRQAVAIPGLSGSIANEKTKTTWVRRLGRKLRNVYQAYPVLASYLEYHVNTKGRSMSLEGRPYLLDIIVDESTEVVVQKSVQCGITEIALARAYNSACAGRSVLYTLPNHPTRNRFVANRVDRQLRVSAYLRAQVRKALETFGTKTADARALKHIGLGTIHFVGSNTAEEFSEYPADELIIDEQDLCDPENLELAKDRLSESEYKRKLRISNPRKPASPASIGKAYEASDRKTWQVRCAACKTEQELTWVGSFVEKTKAGAWRLRDKRGRPICESCNKPFNRLGPGRWVARNPGAKVSGYHISKLFTASTDILELFEEFTKASYNESLLTIFYGSMLGLYHIPKAARVTLYDLLDCIDDELEDYPDLEEERAEFEDDPANANKEYEYPPVVMGVDVGSILHYKASYLDDQGRRVALDIGTVATFGDLAALTDELEPDVIVIDAHPEVHKVTEFASESAYEVWACNFGSPEQIAVIRSKPNDDPPGLTVNRTSALDASYADIKRGGVVYPKAVEGESEFLEQMQVPVRQLDPEAAKGKGRYVWSKGNDHYRLADCYEWVAAQVYDETQVTVTELDGG